MNQPAMNHDQIRREVQDIFRDILGKPDFVLRDELVASDVKGWDSFAHVAIMDAIERHFGISFGLGELDQLTKAGDIIVAVAQKQKR